MPSSCRSGKFVSNIGFNVGLTRTNDVLLTNYTSERTYNPVHETAIEIDNKEKVEIDYDPIWESELNGLKIALFYELEVIPTKSEGSDSDNESPDNTKRTQPNFTTYEPPPHMLNLNINAQDGLEFPKLPHKRLAHSSFINLDDLQVEMTPSNKILYF